MDEKINATSLIHTREDKKRTSVVDVFNVAEVTETLKALQGERGDELQEIHRSWIDSAVDEILKEVKYASYDFIHIPISDVDPYISSVTIDDFVIGMKSSLYAILYNNELSLLPYVTYDKIDVDTSVFMTDATCITKGNNEVVILSSNGQGCKININAYKHGITGATLEEVIQEHGYLQKLFTCPVEPFTDIVFIADRYIAVTGNGKIYKNIENSDNWELVTEYQDKQFTAIASSGNALYCITNDGNSYLSVNYGDDWVNHPMPYPNQYSDITYSEEADTFIACSVNGDYRIAKWDKDSAMWRAFKSSTQHEWQSITSGNGVIVAVGNGVATASYDGEKWYNILIPNHDWTTVTRSNYFFYVFSADGHIVRSANGGITGILFATTDEALKGYETGKPVSPFTMHAFIDSLIATSEEAIEGTHQRKIITPFTMHAFIDSLITTSEEAIEGTHQRKIITPYTMHAFIDSLIATSEEAIEGTHQRKIITPYTMHAFIDSLITTSDEAIEGTHQRKIITPYTMHAFIDSLITTSEEAIEGTHQRKIITPYTMHAFINNSLPWGINKGGTGADTIEQAKINFEINNVDNTSDIDKPISTATQEALDGKVSKAGDTISGDLTINNDLTVEGTSTLDKLVFDTDTDIITVKSPVLDNSPIVISTTSDVTEGRKLTTKIVAPDGDYPTTLDLKTNELRLTTYGANDSTQEIPLGQEASLKVITTAQGAGNQGYFGSLWFGQADVTTDTGTIYDKSAGIAGYNPLDTAQGELHFFTKKHGEAGNKLSMRIRHDTTAIYGNTTIRGNLTVTGNMTTSLLPIGFIYIQFRGQSSPADLFPHATWSNITSTYAGRFFRAEGGSANSFGGQQSGGLPNITGHFSFKVAQGTHMLAMASGAFYTSNSIPISCPDGGGDVCGTGTPDVQINASRSNGLYGAASEIRPVNETIRIWKRIA